MTFTIAFPDFPAADLPAIPASFTDVSWKNDACPCFVSDQLGLELWIDYADPSKREFPDWLRFRLNSQDAGVETSDYAFATDDFAEIVAAIIEQTKNLIETESLGACDQAKLDQLNNTIETLFRLQPRT